MIRHIELVKITEVHEGAFRAERLEKLVADIDAMMREVEGVASYIIDTDESLDPINADLLLSVDFETKEAAEDFDLNLDRLTLAMKIAEQAESILNYEYEV